MANPEVVTVALSYFVNSCIATDMFLYDRLATLAQQNVALKYSGKPVKSWELSLLRLSLFLGRFRLRQIFAPEGCQC